VNPWVKISGNVPFTIEAADDSGNPDGTTIPPSTTNYTYTPAMGKMQTDFCTYTLTTDGPTGTTYPSASVIDAANASKSSFGTVTPPAGDTITIVGNDRKVGE
jgi:hypothetical protein